MTLEIADSLSLPDDVARRVFSFIAMRGAGKTYAAAVLAEEMLRNGVPIIVIDPMGTFWGLKVGKDGTGDGYPLVIFGGDHADFPLDPEKAEKYAQAIVASNISCIFDIGDFTQGETQRFIVKFLNELRRINVQDRHVFMEEVDVIAPQKPMRDEVLCLHAVDVFVRRGGNKNLGCTLISQRSAVVNKNILTQSDFMVAMRTNAPQDKDIIAAWAVKRTAAKSELNAFLDSLSELKDGEAYVWGPDMNIPGIRIKFRERETFHATRENLKKFDASKIKPMDVSEFKERFDKVFNPKSAHRKPVKEGNEKAGEFLEGIHRRSRHQTVERLKKRPVTVVERKPTPIEWEPTESPQAVEVVVSIPKVEATITKAGKTVSFEDDKKAYVIFALHTFGRASYPKDVIAFCVERTWKMSGPDFSNTAKELMDMGIVLKDKDGGYRLPREVDFEVVQR